MSDSPAPAQAGKPAEEETSFVRWLVETILLVAAAFILAQGIKTFVVQPFVIPTGSMIPTIEIDDRVLAEKLTYRFSRGPEYEDIVVFKDPTGAHPQLIKRVIATEGQTVDIRDGTVYIDGKALEEPYLQGVRTEPEGTVSLPIKIPKGYVWVMGDNRPNSGDSRFIGPQQVAAIQGRAIWTYWPLTRFGPLR